MSDLHPVVRIGDWYYQVAYGQLWPTNKPKTAENIIRLEPRLHSLLNFFLQHPNILLAKDRLLEKVWPTDEGTDAAVMRAVGALRKVLGDDVKTPTYIATVSKQGYCWLADIHAVSLLAEPVTTKANTASRETDNVPEPTKKRWPWRFISSSVLVIVFSCASLALVLAKFTAVPLVKLPDAIAPISALSGQEYWPVLNANQSHVIYQHKAPDSTKLGWSRQSLVDLRVVHAPEQYQQLSQAMWLDQQQIIFRASNTKFSCHFYRQQLLPDVAPAVPLWSCNSVLPQGLVSWQGQWLWLDNDSHNNTQLWSGIPGKPAKMLNNLALAWRNVEHMLVDNDILYLLADETENNSILLKLQLPNGPTELVQRFTFKVEQFSWWDNAQLLLSPLDLELQILDLRNLTRQNLGPLTRNLTQALRYPSQVLATQYRDYTTDIFQTTPPTLQDSTVTLMPWHTSNRSERLLAVDAEKNAFVSDRAGHAQIWLEQKGETTQLTRLKDDQQVQQLLWHKNNLLTLVNNQLYQLDIATGSLALYLLQPINAGRYASCEDTLYWTELTNNGWALFTQVEAEKQLIHNDVVDVRCAPEQTLVLQFAEDDRLMLRHNNGNLAKLPVHINWRKQSAEQWFVDNSGVYWLDHSGFTVQAYGWLEGGAQGFVLPLSQQPVAIYSNNKGKGVGYIVQPRPHDTDIVWLKNRH